MKRFFLALLLCCSLAAQADSCDQFVPYGYPQVISRVTPDSTSLCRIAYFALHSNSWKIPYYTVELLLPENVSTENVRKNDFRVDLSVPEYGRATLKDYERSGWDRGHMAAANNMRRDSAALSQSFYLSNMIPQDPSINRGIWKKLEMQVIRWVKKEERELFVITGPVINNRDTFRTIGNQVAVPYETFKIIVDKKQNDAIAFIVPNGRPAFGDLPSKLTEYRIKMDEIEAFIQIRLFPNAPSEIREKLLSSSGASFKLK
jgi:endonuclease G